MSSSKTIYGKRSSGGGHGDVFTLPAVVCFMLDNALMSKLLANPSQRTSHIEYASTQTTLPFAF